MPLPRLTGGVYLTLLVGETSLAPAPSTILHALRSVEVTHSDDERSGFQLSFWLGRAWPLGIMDYPLLSSTLLKPLNRVIVLVTLAARDVVLMDGLITNVQYGPSNEPGAALLTVTGEDVSVAMDLEERRQARPPLTDAALVRQVLSEYPKYLFFPEVATPPVNVQPSAALPPWQNGTDLELLESLAAQYDYVFYIAPGPERGMNRAYWGPQIPRSFPQRALSINMGSATNLDSIDFEYSALSPVTVQGGVVDRDTIQIKRIVAKTLDELVLSQRSALSAQARVRSTMLGPTSGLTYAQALARAEARVLSGSNQTVVARGQLESLRYGAVLRARGLVNVRGAGGTYDGTYYVKTVTHSLSFGAYTQSFILLRQGVGTDTLVVPA